MTRLCNKSIPIFNHIPLNFTSMFTLYNSRGQGGTRGRGIQGKRHCLGGSVRSITVNLKLEVAWVLLTSRKNILGKKIGLQGHRYIKSERDNWNYLSYLTWRQKGNRPESSSQTSWKDTVDQRNIKQHRWMWNGDYGREKWNQWSDFKFGSRLSSLCTNGFRKGMNIYLDSTTIAVETNVKTDGLLLFIMLVVFSLLQLLMVWYHCGKWWWMIQLQWLTSPLHSCHKVTSQEFTQADNVSISDFKSFKRGCGLIIAIKIDTLKQQKIITKKVTLT